MPKYMCEHSHTSRKQLSQSVPARAYPEHVEGLTSSGDKHFENAAKSAPMLEDLTPAM